MHKLLAIQSEPKDALYEELLEFCKRHCHTFSLEWKEGKSLLWDERVPPLKRSFVNDLLKPFALQEGCIHQWQGVDTYRVYYQLNKESAAILLKAQSLFLWGERDSPQNLSFYVENQPWLISDSIHREAYIYPTTIPVEVIEDELPELEFLREKPVIYIEGMNFDNLQEFYEEISRKLLLPGVDWGKNLDAFDDVLDGGFGTPKHGFILVWQNAAVSKERLGYQETIKQLESRRKTCHPSNIPKVDEELRQARQGMGPTVFDWLVEIISQHKIIDLVFE